MDLSSFVHRLVSRQSVAQVAQDALSEVAGGRLAQLPFSFRFWDGSTLPAAVTGVGGDPVTIHVRRPRALAHLLHAPGQIGLVRAYIDGSATLEGEIEPVLALRNALPTTELTAADRARFALAVIKAGGPGVLRRPPIPALESRSTGETHSLSRDRASIRHHYDVSNDFYRLILGPSLVYSCAYYADEPTTLEQAQERKLDLICRKLDLRSDEHLLDIGCGWGALILHAVAHYGVRATGVTLSQEQATLARQRAAEQGLADRVEIRVCDYRELAGRHFDKIASVGMYEHVGRAQLRTYVRTVHDLLRPGGLVLNHGITRLDSEPPAGPNFISRYIFPDGELHPVADLLEVMQDSHLEVRDVESLREHYPLTLRAWLANLRERRAEAEALVGPERVRVWDLYMLGSAIAFEDADISVHQVLATRLGGPHRLPLDRMALLAPDRGDAASDGAEPEDPADDVAAPSGV